MLQTGLWTLLVMISVQNTSLENAYVVLCCRKTTRWKTIENMLKTRENSEFHYIPSILISCIDNCNKSRTNANVLPSQQLYD